MLNVAFTHPDLGIGGAERLIVDSACGLIRSGHSVTIYTSYHDPHHSFPETNSGLLPVFVLGNTLIPSGLFGNKFKALCAYLRSLHLASSLVYQGLNVDVIIVDQVSVAIPILKLMGVKVLFYCHYPDKLLTGRDSFIKKLYRYPVDFIEEWTTNQADKIVVNSLYTQSVFQSAFKSISIKPDVLYPGIHVDNYQPYKEIKHSSVDPLKSDKITLVSINRFERKKDLPLAIQAFTLLKDDQYLGEKRFKDLRLIVAGGYDPSNQENVDHLIELEVLAKTLNLISYILKPNSSTSIIIPNDVNLIFLPSFDSHQRSYLLSPTHSRLLLYTPANEHFGIVPVESMYSKLPVIAKNSGGPKESVLHEQTGYLAQPNKESFAEFITKLVKDENLSIEIGKSGYNRVVEKFTSEKFDLELSNMLVKLVEEDNKGMNLSAIIFAFIVYSLFHLWLMAGFF